MILRVLERVTTEEKEPAVVYEIEVRGIDPLRVTPVGKRVGSPLSIQELTELLVQVQPSDPLKPEEPESYYALNTAAWRDGDLSPTSIDIPHHIGLRVVLAGILEKYGASDYLIEIS